MNVLNEAILVQLLLKATELGCTALSWIPTRMSQHTQAPPHPIGQYLSLERIETLGLLTPAFSQFKVSNTSLWYINPNLGQDPGAILNF